MRVRAAAAVVKIKIRSDGLVGVATSSHTIHIVFKKKKPKK